MKASVANKKMKTTTFQVLLLDNDASEDVEVHEAEEVNFVQVKEHLKNGGSVFITSKDSQKQLYPDGKAQRTIASQEELTEPFFDGLEKFLNCVTCIQVIPFTPSLFRIFLGARLFSAN